MGAKPGSLGAVRGTIKNPEGLAGVYADQAVRLIGNGVTGANRDGFHCATSTWRANLAITRFGDFRRVREGEPCPKSGHPLKIRRAIEVEPRVSNLGQNTARSSAPSTRTRRSRASR